VIAELIAKGEWQASLDRLDALGKENDFERPGLDQLGPLLLTRSMIAIEPSFCSNGVHERQRNSILLNFHEPLRRMNGVISSNSSVAYVDHHSILLRCV
jgi:hypothetical protein